MYIENRQNVIVGHKLRTKYFVEKELLSRIRKKRFYKNKDAEEKTVEMFKGFIDEGYKEGVRYNFHGYENASVKTLFDDIYEDFLKCYSFNGEIQFNKK